MSWVYILYFAGIIYTPIYLNYFIYKLASSQDDWIFGPLTIWTPDITTYKIVMIYFHTRGRHDADLARSRGTQTSPSPLTIFHIKRAKIDL